MAEPTLEELERFADRASTFVQGIVERIELGAVVTSRIDGDAVHVDVRGSDLGLLIGHRGATLDALQEVTRCAMQQGTIGYPPRIHVDVASYREERRQALAAFATETARRALETGRDQTLEPMSSADRKVVHDTIAEIDGVSTTSEGEEPRRRVVVRRS